MNASGMTRTLARLACAIGIVLSANALAPSLARAECSISPMDDSQKKVFNLCVEAMRGKDLLPGEREADGTLKGLLYSSARCFQGIGDSVIDAAKGIAYFFKILAIEAPKFVWDKSKKASVAVGQWIADKWNGATDAVSGAADAADANSSVYDGLMNAAKNYWQAFKDFIKSVGDKIDRDWKEFKCLPASLQSQILCKLTFDAFLLVVTPEKILKGAQWTVDLGRAVSKLFETIRASQILADGSVIANVEKLSTAVATGAKAMEEGSIVRRLGNARLVEYVDEAGQKILKLERRVGENWVAREVVIDGDTGTILRGTQQGKELLNTVLTQAAADAGKTKTAIAVVDVNYLGKVNYFKGAAVAGDNYLKAVAQAIKSVVRQDSLIFRYGGDEFLIDLEKITPQEAQSLFARINQAVAESPEARAIFNAQRKAMAAQYRAVNAAGSLAELPAGVADGLSASEKALAESDFAKFKGAFLQARKEAIQTMSKMRPTVSIGSTMVREGDTADQIVERASEQVGKVKGTYKRALGLDAEKYGTTTIDGAEGAGAPTAPKPSTPAALAPDE